MGTSYRPTAADMELLAKYKSGKSVGFTGRSSLRAKALIPRTSKKYKGLYVLGPKYSGTGQDKIVRSKGITRRRRRN
jgi:hypothetical protein